MTYMGTPETAAGAAMWLTLDHKQAPLEGAMLERWLVERPGAAVRRVSGPLRYRCAYWLTGIRGARRLVGTPCTRWRACGDRRPRSVREGCGSSRRSRWDCVGRGKVADVRGSADGQLCVGIVVLAGRGEQRAGDRRVGRQSVRGPGLFLVERGRGGAWAYGVDLLDRVGEQRAGVGRGELRREPHVDVDGARVGDHREAVAAVDAGRCDRGPQREVWVVRSGERGLVDRVDEPLTSSGRLIARR